MIYLWNSSDSLSFPFTQGIFVFCLVWSVGASCDDLGRLKFDAVVREILNGPLSEGTRACHGILATVEAPAKPLTVSLPAEGTVYQYCFTKEVRPLLINVQLKVLCCILFAWSDICTCTFFALSVIPLWYESPLNTTKRWHRIRDLLCTDSCFFYVLQCRLFHLCAPLSKMIFQQAKTRYYLSTWCVFVWVESD